METDLPIEAALPALRAALRSGRSVILSAPPGAGKTTRVPRALLAEPWLASRGITMLEPRRLAAQHAALFMASLLGERVGETVGYRIRGETRVSRSTRIEVVTEGVLTRLLQQDPGLPGVGLLVFDEFHERSIHADLGLALALDVQRHLRPDLRLLVMSATLDGGALRRVLPEAEIVESTGRSYPVETRYLAHPPAGPLEHVVAAAVMRALAWSEGDLLVFLPGQAEIRRTASRLAELSLPAGVRVHMLYGDAPPAEQQAALVSLGPRRVILSTSIAETSLTVEGVRVVIDAGLARVARFDLRRGMSGLVTGPVSRASADQRRGRAGRQAAGVCYRLWTEEQHRYLPLFQPPEILVTDLAPLALELARWGDPEGKGLQFIDPPPDARLQQARGLLQELGALDEDGRITQHGQAMAELPLHPRLAHMLLRARERGLAGLACDVAALLEERDLLRGGEKGDVDLASRLHVLRAGLPGDRRARERVLAESRRLRALLQTGAEEGDPAQAGLLLALAYPERVAKRRGGGEHGRYQLAGGMGAVLPAGSLLAREEFLGVADVDAAGTEARIYLAAPLSEEEIVDHLPERIRQEREVRWDPVREQVIARSARMLGALTLREQPLAAESDPGVRREIVGAMLEGVRQLGLDALPWDRETASIRTRSEWLRQRGFVAGGAWPDLSDAQLLSRLAEWLGPFLTGVTRRGHLARLEMTAILRSRFSHQQWQELNRLAPAVMVAPTGTRIRLEYTGSEDPVAAVRLQEMFGQRETPTVAGGRSRVVVHLLSPAGRPLAVTQDLSSFWVNVYPEVRKEMRGRYPKHIWPEDPLAAPPTRRTTKPRAAR